MSNIQTNVVKPEIRFSSNESDYLLINPEFESSLDNKIELIKSFMLNDGKNKDENEQNKLYEDAQNLWNDYTNYLKEAKYNFHLNRVQWKFLTDLLLSKLEYDVNTVFIAIELTELLGDLRSINFTNDKELKEVPVNATEITYIYHLISKHTIKGLTKDAYTFSDILIRIGNISKLFNYYDAFTKSLSSDIQNWVSSFEEGVILESIKTDVVEGVVLEN